MADTNRKSLYEIIGLPSEFGVVLLTFGLVLFLSPYLSGFDFGIFQIPKLDPKMQQNLRILGPIIFIGLIFLFVPIWKRGKSHKETSNKSLKYRSADKNAAAEVTCKLIIRCPKPKFPGQHLFDFYAFPAHHPYCFITKGDSKPVKYDLSWDSEEEFDLIPEVPYQLTVQFDNTQDIRKFFLGNRPNGIAKYPGKITLLPGEKKRITYKAPEFNTYNKGQLI